MIELPTTQKEEVLYLLIKNPKGLTRVDLMARAYVLNAPEAIRRLREQGVAIHREDRSKKNKFGRTAIIGKYVLTHPKMAMIQYKKMINK